MSRDIRSYFMPAGGAKKKESSSEKQKAELSSDKLHKKHKKRLIIIESDSDEEDPIPKRFRNNSSSDEFEKASEKKKTKSSPRKPDPKPALQRVNAADIFGNEPVKRSSSSTFAEKRPKGNSAKKAAKELYPDVDFAATLEQLDQIEPPKSKKKKLESSSTEHQSEKKKHEDKAKELKPAAEELKEKKAKAEKRRESPEKPTKTPSKVSNNENHTTPQKTLESKPVKVETPKQKSRNETPKHERKEDDIILQTPSPSDPLEKRRQHAISYQRYLQRQGPRNPGSKEIPEGQPGCLSGMVFVVTGVLESLDREETMGLIQKYGGRVTGNVSRNTTYLIVGDEAGVSKLAKAEKCGTKQINEDGLLDLIRASAVKEGKHARKESGDSEQRKKRKETHKEIVKEEDLDMKKFYGSNKKSPVKKVDAVSKRKHDVQDSAQKKTSDKASTTSTTSSAKELFRKCTNIESSLWVDKYKPTNTKQIIGQQGDKSNVKKLTKWLGNWYQNHSGGKKLSRPSPWAKDDDGAFFKAALLSGPPGVGKTTSAHLVSKELGFDVVEFNASDTRSKKSLHEEVSELLSNKSLAGYFHNELPQTTSKHVLLMDEVDGMAGNEDRGGMQELIQLIKNSKVPIICMCNDRNHPKIRSLVNYCFDLRFQKPRLEQIRSALMSVCYKEGLKMKPEALTDVIVGSNQDLRQILHHLSMWTVKENLTAEQAKIESQRAKKDTKLGPWDVVKKVFSAEDHKSMSIHDKSDLFFHDYSLSPLFVQENYLTVSPHSARGNQLKLLDVVAKAAESICTGDVVDRAIRSRNSWSLLPVQAMFASVIPGDLMEGHFTGQINFPSWLGKNSRRGKFDRHLQELQMHMRLSMTGSKQAINLDYLTPIRDAIIHPLKKYEAEGVAESVKVLQEYHLLREDLDSIIELSTWPNQRDPMADVPSKVKAAFTRTYNKESPAMPYAVVAVQKKKGAESSSQDFGADEEEFGDEEQEEDDDDITNDAMIKARKKPAAKADTAGSSGRGRGRGKTTEGGGRGRGKGR